MAIQENIDIPQDVTDALGNMLSKFEFQQVRDRIWDGILTQIEQRQLGDDFNGRAIVTIFARSRGYSPRRAIVDLSLAAGIIVTGEHARVRRLIGEPLDQTDLRPRPTWNAASGKLYYEGLEVRQYGARATNLRPILDMFEELHWPNHIDSPLPGGRNSKKIRDAIVGLNKDLANIVFRSDGTASGIVWDVGRQRDAGATPAHHVVNRIAAVGE